MTRAKISNVMNEGVRMSCKSVTTKFYTIVGLLIEIIIAIGKKTSLRNLLQLGKLLLQ